MEINYYISARGEALVQGINVSLSAEFQKNNIPATVYFSSSGNFDVNGEPVFMNINGGYNVEKRIFNNLNSSFLPSGFVAELETKVIEFFNQIKIDQAL